MDAHHVNRDATWGLSDFPYSLKKHAPGLQKTVHC